MYINRVIIICCLAPSFCCPGITTIPNSRWCNCSFSNCLLPWEHNSTFFSFSNNRCNYTRSRSWICQVKHLVRTSFSATRITKSTTTNIKRHLTIYRSIVQILPKVSVSKSISSRCNDSSNTCYLWRCHTGAIQSGIPVS